MKEPTQEELDSYEWYHYYKFPGGAMTRKTVDCPDVWEHIEKTLMLPEFYKGKDVLDVGCRDCWWSLRAEQLGARSVTGVDISLNPGVAKVILPYYESKVRQVQLNVMKLRSLGVTFDTILCPGVLYHLRYPFGALKVMVDVLRPGGTLLIETALLARPELEEMPLLWCPVETSPYESTSCTLFNVNGLLTTARSFGLASVATFPMRRKLFNPEGMDRGTFVFTKGKADEFLETYWNEEASLQELAAKQKVV